MVQYKLLKTTHQDYDDVAVLKEDLLYQGGQAIKAQAHLFLQKLDSESHDNYQSRLQSAAYVPYLGKFIDFFVASLFAEDVMVVDQKEEGDSSPKMSEDEFWVNFSKDCDMAETSFENFLHNLFTTALVHGCAYVGLDFPRPNSDTQPMNLAQEQEMGMLRGYVYHVPNASVVDYLCDPVSCNYVWLKLRSDLPYQPTPLDEPMHQLEFKLWTLNEQGQAQFQVYRTAPLKMGEEPKDTDEVPLIDEGTTLFEAIPILQLRIPDGLAIGDKLSPLAEEHFQRRSIENSATNKACVTIPVVKKGPSIPASGGQINPTALNQNRGNNPVGKFNSQGWVEISSDDDIKIVEAEGKALGFIHKQNEDLVEQMHGIVHQMAQHIQRNQMASSRSADSKMEDRHATEIMLTAYAELVEDIALSIYQVIASVRGEEANWVVRGLTTTEYPDRQQLLQEALNVQNINIPSQTFKLRYQYNLAVALLGQVSEQEEQELLTELQGAVNTPDPNQNQLGQTLQDKFGQDLHVTNPDHASGDGPDDPQVADLVNDQGVMNGFEGMHLADAEHTHFSEIHDLLKDDYSDKDLEWLKMIPWKGPVAVPISSIDFRDVDQWRASQPGPDGQDKVHEFAQRMADTGQWKPVVLINEPHTNRKMWPVDGRHRILAAKETGQDVVAYVGEVGEISNDHPGVQLHSKQTSYKNSSIQEPAPGSSNDKAPKQHDKPQKGNPNTVYTNKNRNGKGEANGEFVK